MWQRSRQRPLPALKRLALGPERTHSTPRRHRWRCPARLTGPSARGQRWIVAGLAPRISPPRRPRSAAPMQSLIWTGGPLSQAGRGGPAPRGFFRGTWRRSSAWTFRNPGGSPRGRRQSHRDSFPFDAPDTWTGGSNPPPPRHFAPGDSGGGHPTRARPPVLLQRCHPRAPALGAAVRPGSRPRWRQAARTDW